MPKLVDQYGNEITRETLMTIFNQGPLSYGLGQAWFSGFLGSYINPDQLNVKNYQDMYDYDDACSSGIDFVTLSVLGRLGEYTHPDKRITDLIHAEIEKGEGSLLDDIEEAASEALKCGFIAGELCYKIDKNVHLDDIQFLDPVWTEFELWTSGENRNKIKSVRQNGIILTNPTSQESIPLDKFFIFSNGGRYGNPYGRSRLKSAYPMYYFKKGMLTAWAITMQKHGTPARSAEIDVNAPQEISMGEGQESISIYDFLQGCLASWTNKTDIVLPPGVKLAVQSTAAGNKAGFDVCINYADKCIYRALLLPGLVASTADSGMRALGEIHYKMYDLGIKRYRNRVAEAIVRQIFRRLIIWNFGEQENYGKFNYRELSAEEQKMEMDTFKEATDSGYITPDRLEDFKHVRNRIGAPEISDEEFAQMQVEKKAHAEEIQKRLDAKRQAMEGQPKPDIQKPEELSVFSRLNGLESYFVEV